MRTWVVVVALKGNMAYINATHTWPFSLTKDCICRPQIPPSLPSIPHPHLRGHLQCEDLEAVTSERGGKGGSEIGRKGERKEGIEGWANRQDLPSVTARSTTCSLTVLSSVCSPMTFLVGGPLVALCHLFCGVC